ncbi:MAG: ABC transporter substrate-binding protein [Cyanobacteriota bacterium]
MPAYGRLTPWPLALMTAVLLLGLASCQSTRPPGRLIVASRHRIDSVDPAAGTTVGALQLLSALGDPLYAITAEGRLEPRLAQALPAVSADGLRARIRLRPGVTFQDGTAFDAEAMAFSLRRFLAIGKLSYLLGDRVKGVRVIAPLTLELELRRPYSPLPRLLSAISLTPVSPTAYRQHQHRYLNDRFIGTGPYRLTLFNTQQQRLEPFRGYWGRPPANRGLELVNLSNSTALYGAMQSGEVDVLLSTSLENDQQMALHRQAAAGRLREGVGPALEIGYLSLLTSHPPLDDPRLRRALALSLDRRLIQTRVSEGLRPSLRTVVPTMLPGSAPASWPTFNPRAARSLFRQAGYCRGRILTLPFTFRSNIPSDRLFALTWQAQLQRDLSDCVALQVTGMEATTAYRQLGDGAFTMILLDWIADFPDADNYLMPLLSCEQSRGQRCLRGASAASGSFWSEPGLEESLRRSARLRGAARHQLLEALQRRTAAAVPYLPVWGVAPRAWARPGLRTPRFDGSGRVLLMDLAETNAPPLTIGDPR